MCDKNHDDPFSGLASTAADLRSTRAPTPVEPTDNPNELAEKEYAGERHTCHECSGTGIYPGRRIHQEKQHCFACKGKGWFKTSYGDRLKARAKVAKRKAAEHDSNKATFCEANKGLIEGLREIASWHQFAGTLVASFEQWGSLTERQTLAGHQVLAKVAEGRAKRAAERDAKSGEVSATAIEAMFRTAKENGLKKPFFRTTRLKISLAPAASKNAGAIYVKCDGVYSGKIMGGTFSPSREAPADILDLVRTVAASPIEAARKYGRDTGTCSCCGRELSDPASVEAGIGPICANNFGL